MKLITGVCLMLVVLGILSGYFLSGNIFGSVMGLCIAACLAVLLYCLVSIFKRNAATIMLDPFQDAPSFVNLDPSQLPRGAYDRESDG